MIYAIAHAGHMKLTFPSTYKHLEVSSKTDKPYNRNNNPAHKYDDEGCEATTTVTTTSTTMKLMMNTTKQQNQQQKKTTRYIATLAKLKIGPGQ